MRSGLGLWAVVAATLATGTGQAAAVPAAAVPAAAVPAAAVPASTTGYQWGQILCTSGSAPLPQSATSQAVAAVDGGRDHALWLTSQGQVLIHGTSIDHANPDGSIGGLCYGNPHAVAGLTDVTQVAAGNGFSVALRSDGTVATWGLNQVGQLGDGTTVTRGDPRPVPGLSDVIDVAAGDDHAVALLRSGAVVAWGANTYGQLGDGTTLSRSAPAPVLSLTGIKDVAAGSTHSFAITADQQLRAWGRNTDGQLGDGTTVNRMKPVTVVDRYGIDPLTKVTQVDGGAGVSAAIVAASATWGSVYTWGSQTNGQLGDGDTIGNQTTPEVPIQLPSSASQLSVGLSHSVVRMTNGRVYAWGRNGLGQTGNNKPTSVEPRPVRTIGEFSTATAAQVAATGDTSLAAIPPLP